MFLISAIIVVVVVIRFEVTAECCSKLGQSVIA